MRKPKVIVSSLCLITLLALAMPTSVYAIDEGPQGGSNSTKGAPPAPPPPPPSAGGLVGELLALLLS